MFRLFTFSCRALVCALFLLLPLVVVNAQFRATVQGTVTFLGSLGMMPPFGFPREAAAPDRVASGARRGFHRESAGIEVPVPPRGSVPRGGPRFLAAR